VVNPLVAVRAFSLSRGRFRLKNVSLDIRPNEKFALLGRTGAGKTVLLESIAGFYRGETGTILLDGKPVEKISPEQRGIGFVYQDQGLFPHLTVYHNISYGLRMRKVSRDEIKAQVLRAAELLSIPHIMEQYPATLSGGERQRAALARAMVLKPRPQRRRCTTRWNASTALSAVPCCLSRTIFRRRRVWPTASASCWTESCWS
jgi:molybdate transport system ATP-binding protein